MSYDYAGYHHRQYDLPQLVQPFHPYHARKPTCWDPPWMRQTTAYQQSLSYELDMYSPPPPRRRPTCWDPPAYRETPRQRPFHEVSTYVQPLAPDSNFHWNNPYTACDKAAPTHTFPRRYSARQTASHQPRSATIVEDPINAKLDRLLEAFDRMETWVGATNRRFSKFRSSPQPEPDLDQPHVSAPLRKRAYPPSRNNEASFGPSGLVPNDSAAPPRHPTKSDQTPARQSSCWEPPQMATPAVDQMHQPYHVKDSLLNVSVGNSSTAGQSIRRPVGVSGSSRTTLCAGSSRRATRS